MHGWAVGNASGDVGEAVYRSVQSCISHDLPRTLTAKARPLQPGLACSRPSALLTDQRGLLGSPVSKRPR